MPKPDLAELIKKRKDSGPTKERKRRQRARDLWQQLQHEGYQSLEELERETEKLNVPKTWAGRDGASGRRKISKADHAALPDHLKPYLGDKSGTENVTMHDLPPSKKAVESLVKNLKPKR